MKLRRSLYSHPKPFSEESSAPRRSLDRGEPPWSCRLRPWPESRWQCLPPSSPDCRSPQAAPASPNPRTAVQDRAASSRWSRMPGRLLRRPAPAGVHCLASALRSSRPRSNRPGGRRPWSSRPVSSHPSRRVSNRPSVQAVGCSTVRCPPRPPSPRAARRSAQLDLEQVTPAEAWVSRRASIGRDLAGCRWVAAVAALDWLIDEAARPLRGSPVGGDRASVGSGLNERMAGCRPDSVRRLRSMVVINGGRLSGPARNGQQARRGGP
jgi:hypothetical protein